MTIFIVIEPQDYMRASATVHPSRDDAEAYIRDADENTHYWKIEEVEINLN